MIRIVTKPFVVLWKQRDLARQFGVRVLLERTRGSFLGIMWQILVPLLMMSLYTFVFGILFKGSFNPGEKDSSLVYGIGIYIGLSLLGLVNDTLGTSSYSILSSPNLVKKVVFPLEILPLSAVAFPFVQAVVGLMIAGLALSFLGHSPGLSWIWIPVIVFPVLLLSIGLSWLIGSLTVYFKDLVHLMSLITQILFWSSGIFYSAQTVQEYPVVWSVLKWNPVLLVIEEIRKVMIWDISVSMDRVAYLYVVGIFFWLFGYFVFDRLRKGFADIL